MRKYCIAGVNMRLQPGAIRYISRNQMLWIVSYFEHSFHSEMHWHNTAEVGFNLHVARNFFNFADSSGRTCSKYAVTISCSPQQYTVLIPTIFRATCGLAPSRLKGKFMSGMLFVHVFVCLNLLSISTVFFLDRRRLMVFSGWNPTLHSSEEHHQKWRWISLNLRFGDILGRWDIFINGLARTYPETGTSKEFRDGG